MVEWATPRQLGHLHEFAHHALAQAALGAGDFEECYANATAISPPGTLGSHTTQALWVALDLVDAAVHTGRDREARAHADAMRRADLGRSRRGSLSSPPQRPRWSPPTTKHRICSFRHLHFRRSRSGRSRSLECDSRTANGCVGCADIVPPESSSKLPSTGSSGSAPAVVATSRDRAAPPPVPPASARSSGGAAPLTLQEREIALLAATGMTNREIATQLYVSPRTVSAHLYRIFPKLGITSRAALRDALGATSGVGSAP